jgi:hypothetical protein
MLPLILKNKESVTIVLVRKHDFFYFKIKWPIMLCLPRRRNSHNSVTQLFEPQETPTYNTHVDLITPIFLLTSLLDFVKHCTEECQRCNLKISIAPFLVRVVFLHARSNLKQETKQRTDVHTKKRILWYNIYEGSDS